MPTDAMRGGPGAAATAGLLLLCGAEPDSVAPVAPLLRERMVLTGAGREWSVLVPEGSPWWSWRPEGSEEAETVAGAGRREAHRRGEGRAGRAGGAGGEPVDRVAAGWAVALAVGSSWPVLALWWAAGRAGYVLTGGFRRPVSCVWAAGGTATGDAEAMRVLVARLGLDPVRDGQSLEQLITSGSGADALARLRGLIAVLTRAGIDLPRGLTPGASPGRLLEAAARAPGGTRWIAGEGWWEAVRADFGPAAGAVTGTDVRREAGDIWRRGPAETGRSGGDPADGARADGPGRAGGPTENGPGAGGGSEAGGPKANALRAGGGPKADGPSEDGPKADGPSEDGPKADGPGAGGAKADGPWTGGGYEAGGAGMPESSRSAERPRGPESSGRSGSRGRPVPPRAAGTRTGGPRRAYDAGALAPWAPGSGDPRARWLGMAQVAAGVPATTWGVWRHSGGWAAAGALLLAHGALGMRYGTSGPRPPAVVYRPWD